MARLTLALLSAVLGSGLMAAPANAETGITDKEIVIGAFGVLTGPVYNYGKTAFDGAEMIYNETNAAGGINGRQIRFVREDDQCKPDVAVPAVRKLIYDDKVFMISGRICRWARGLGGAGTMPWKSGGDPPLDHEARSPATEAVARNKSLARLPALAVTIAG